MVDFGPEFSSLSPSEQSAVQLCVDELGKEYPEAASSVTVSKTAVGLTLTIVAPGKYEQIVNAMVEPITSIMLSTGVLLFLTQGRRDPNAAPPPRAPEPPKAPPPPPVQEAPPPPKPPEPTPPPKKEAPPPAPPEPPAPKKEEPARAPQATRTAPITAPSEIVCTCGNLVPAGEPYCNVCGNILEEVAPTPPTASGGGGGWPLTIPTALKSYANAPAGSGPSSTPTKRSEPTWTTSAISLYQDGQHFNVRTTDDPNSAVDLTRHVIIHGQSALLLDPGGYKVFPRIMSELETVLGRRVQLEHIILTHEGPEVASGLNSWMMTTKATTWIAGIWSRFVPHYGLDERYWPRLQSIPDDGMWLDLDGAPLAFLPAHFQHSSGNFHVWDPTSRILYTSDLGASLERGFHDVKDFDEHIARMLDFHRRHVASKRAVEPWVRMVRKLDPRIIAPQHGPHFEGPEMVKRFLDWCIAINAGMDLLPPAYELPPG